MHEDMKWSGSEDMEEKQKNLIFYTGLYNLYIYMILYITGLTNQKSPCMVEGRKEGRIKITIGLLEVNFNAIKVLYYLVFATPKKE